MNSSTGRWVSGDNFFDRERELRILETRVRDRNHILLTGQRRMGKTSIVQELGRRLEAEGWLFLFADVERANCARETHADLTDHWPEKMPADRVLATVLDAADRLGKKLVLMVENLQTLCEDVDEDFGWQLRGTLQSEPQIMLLATATSRFKGLDDAEQPFFEQFRILDLEPLNTEECRRLWQIATGDAVSEDGIRPLEILTGGSPRLLVIVAGFAQHRSLRQLMEELVMLIDEHTEYFRGHLEVLPKSERRVYLSVIDLWQPSSAGEIAVRARMDVRYVSTMLGRLANRGAVIFEGTGRKRHTCEDIERRLDALTGNEKIEFTWRAKCMRVMVLMVQKKYQVVMDTFRSAYAMFASDNETMMNEMLYFVPELIAHGAPECDLIEILSSDKEKSDALVPLIVALRERTGEVVRAPVEILEVAKDINKDIDARTAN